MYSASRSPIDDSPDVCSAVRLATAEVVPAGCSHDVYREDNTATSSATCTLPVPHVRPSGPASGISALASSPPRVPPLPELYFWSVEYAVSGANGVKGIVIAVVGRGTVFVHSPEFVLG